MSYLRKIAIASLAGDEEAANWFTQQGMDDISARIKVIEDEFGWDDRPLVAASLELAAKALRETLGDAGKEICDDIVRKCKTIIITIPMVEEDE